MDVHTLTIKLAGDVGDLLQKMNLAKRGVDGAMSGMESAIGGVKTAMAGLAAGLTAGAFASMIRNSIDLADGLNDLSKSTGLTVEKLSGLKLAAKQSGGDLESIAASVNKLSVNIAKDAEKFAKLGVSAKDPLEAFKQLADVFSAIEDPQLRAALGAEALGKSWQGAAPLLAEGGQRIGEMVAKGEALSGITQEMADKADAFNDQMAEMEAKVSGAKMKLAGEMLPAMVDITAAITAAYEESGKLSAIWVGIGALGAFTFTNEFESATTKIKDLREELAALEQEKHMAENQPMVGIVSRWLFGSSDVNGDIAKAKASIADLQAQMDKPSKDAAQRRADAEAAKKSAAEAAEAARKATAFLDLKRKAEAATATELKKQSDLIATLSGVSADYMEQLSRLQAIRAKGNISEERYIELVTELIDKQPMVVKLAKEQEDLEKERLKIAEAARTARYKEIEVAEKSNESMEEGNNALREEIELIGLSEPAQLAILQQRNEVIILTKEAALAELQRQSAITQTQTRVEIALAAEIKALKERNQLLGAKQAKTTADSAAKDIATEGKRTADQLEQSITDGLMRGFENGKGFIENLRDNIVNTFKTMVLRPQVQAVVQGGLNAVGLGGGAGGVFGDAGGSFASSMLGNVTIAGSSLAAIGSSVATGVQAGWAGTSIAAASEAYAAAGMTGISTGLTAGSAIGSTAASISAGVSSALAAIPGWGWAAMAVLAIANMKGSYVQSLGETVATVAPDKSIGLGGSGGNNDVSIGGGLNIRQTEVSDKFVNGIAAAFVQATGRFGVSSAGASFGAGFNDSDGGKFAVEATVGGRKYDPGQIKITDANLALEASRAVFFALQSSELPGYLSKVFDGITATSASQADIDAALNYATSLKTIRDALTETREPLQILKDTVAESFAALGTSADTFKTDFVSAIDSGISPDKLAEYLKLGQNLDALAAASGTASEAVKDTGRSLTDIASERTRLQDQLDGLTLSSAQMLEKQRAAIDESNVALFDQVQTAQAAKTAADALAEAQSNLANTNAGLQDRLDVLTGAQTERSLQLRDATDESTEALLRQIFAQEDAKTAQQTLTDTSVKTAQALADAAQALADAAQALKSALQTDLDASRSGVADAFAAYRTGIETQKAMVTTTYTNQAEAIRTSLGTVGESIGKLKSLSSSLKSTLDGMRLIGAEGVDRARAQAQISAALATARAGGGLPVNGQLDSALRTASQSTDEQFKSFADYSFDFYRTANDIAALGDLAGAQLSGEALTQSLLQTQADTLKTGFDGELKRLDDLVNAAQAQADATTKSTTSIQSMADALLRFTESLGVTLTNSLATAFDAADLDKSNGVSRAEFQASFKGLASESTLKAIFDKTDANGNGQISQLEAINANTANLLARISVAAAGGTQAGAGTFTGTQVVEEVNKLLAGGASTASVINTASSGYGVSSGSLAQVAGAFTQDPAAQAFIDYQNRIAAQPVFDPDERAGIVAQVSAAAASNGTSYELELYKLALANGYNAGMVDKAMGFTNGTANAWATANGYPAFMNGGTHAGGWAMVGEQGPELAYMPPARIYSAPQTAGMLGGGDALLGEVRLLRLEVAELKTHLQNIDTSTSEHLQMFDEVSEGGNAVRSDVMNQKIKVQVV